MPQLPGPFLSAALAADPGVSDHAQLRAGPAFCSGEGLRLIMKEEDPLKFDKLGEEIWRVLDERERVGAMPSSRTIRSCIGAHGIAA